MKNMISRRNFLAAAGVVAAAGVLTACGGSSSTAASAAGSTAAAASGDTIKVGVMGPLSGNVSVYGQAVVNGATLYLKQVNANGGINGKQIEILTEDEQGDATQAVNCFTKMVDEGMTALIGDVTTTPTLAVVAESADYNMPMVTASATAEAVTYDAETDTVNANVFRATFTDPFQGIKMADYAYQKLGYTKAAVIFKKGADYNEGLAENFVNEFESLGGTIVDQESYSEGDVDFKTQLTTILGKDPETVFCPNYYEEVGQILSQAESVGLTVPFLGGDGWDGLEGYATNDQLKDTYFCANYAKGSNPEFEDAYKAEYGQEYPNGFSPLGYDAAKTVVYGLQAAEDAGLEAGTDDYKQAVIDAIASGTIDGITGTFTFDEHHDPVKQTAILTYVDGKPVLDFQAACKTLPLPAILFAGVVCVMSTPFSSEATGISAWLSGLLQPVFQQCTFRGKIVHNRNSHAANSPSSSCTYSNPK